MCFNRKTSRSMSDKPAYTKKYPVQNINSYGFYISIRPFVLLTSGLQTRAGLCLGEPDCTKHDTESERTQQKAPHASVLLPCLSHLHHLQATVSLSIQPSNLRNARRFPAWRAFVCSPGAEGARRAAEWCVAGLSGDLTRCGGSVLRHKCTSSGRVCFGEWETISATPPPHQTVFTAKEAPRRPADSYFIVLQQESVNCVTASQCVYKTWIAFHQHH